MDTFLVAFVSALFLVPITLLPIINPLGTATVFAAAVGKDRQLASRLARQVAINAWVVMVVAMLIGNYVLALFGISLPVVRIGGGLLVAAAAWRMLHRKDDDVAHEAAADEAIALSRTEFVRRSFFPITFPLTTGPGTIAAAIALGAGIPTSPVLFAAGVAVAAAGAALVSLILYLIFANSGRVLEWLGEVGALVMTQLMAFILLCIGIQIMWTGWSELNGIYPA
jgi:multiple antibiotic resistance protein